MLRMFFHAFIFLSLSPKVPGYVPVVPDKVTVGTQAPNKHAKMPTDKPQEGGPAQKSVFIIPHADVTARTLDSVRWFANADYRSSSCTEKSGAADGCVQSNVVSAPHGRRRTAFSALLNGGRVNSVREISRSSLFSLLLKKGEGLHISYVIGGALTVLAILILIAVFIIYRCISTPLWQTLLWLGTFVMSSSLVQMIRSTLQYYFSVPKKELEEVSLNCWDASGVCVKTMS